MSKNKTAAPVTTPGDLKPFKTYGICRIDQEEKRNHGWYVRVKGQPERWFADKKCGSKKKALADALACRDELFRKMSPVEQERASKKSGKSRAKLE